MSKAVRQYRFYNSADNTSRNQPSNISVANLISGSIFFNEAELGAITQLGIQTLPGTKFYLNNSITPVIIGYTGIYELDLRSEAEITALAFDSASVNTINTIGNAYLIVDAVYEVED